MKNMFTNCSSLTSLDISNFHNEKNINFQDIFNGCSLLKYIDISGFTQELNALVRFGLPENCTILINNQTSIVNSIIPVSCNISYKE